jgi:DNA-binding transcriptional regulator YdaS (Cro superfamily)
MKLADYLAKNGIKPAQFARLVGTSRQNVHRWLQGTAMPRVDQCWEIQRATKGNVTMVDFVERPQGVPRSKHSRIL